MNLILETEYFVEPDAVTALAKLEIDADYLLVDCPTEPITFYDIESISPYQENDNEFCVLQSGGLRYIINATYSSIKKVIEDNITE